MPFNLSLSSVLGMLGVADAQQAYNTLQSQQLEQQLGALGLAALADGLPADAVTAAPPGTMTASAFATGALDTAAVSAAALEYEQQQYWQASQEFALQQQLQQQQYQQQYQQYYAPVANTNPYTPTPGQPLPSYPGTPYIQQQQLPDLPPDILAKLEEMLKLRACGVDPAPAVEPPVEVGGERNIALGGLEP